MLRIDPDLQNRKPSFKEKQEHEVLQREIEMLEEEKKIVMEKLTNNSLDHLQLQEYSSKIELITSQIDEKMLRLIGIG